MAKANGSSYEWTTAGLFCFAYPNHEREICIGGRQSERFSRFSHATLWAQPQVHAFPNFESKIRFRIDWLASNTVPTGPQKVQSFSVNDATFVRESIEKRKCQIEFERHICH